MSKSNNSDFSNIEFDLPMNQSNVIKVIGVGGGGSNAVNHMLTQGINGVDFVVCNTDAQALQNSQVPSKIQLGASLTEGLGAGANPEIGEQSALESEEEIKRMLGSNTKMVFINAGMGGGTGTGAAPVIAKFAKELNLLTIGIVTIPFSFEGKTRNEQAQNGINQLSKYVDSMVVINNNKLRDVYGNLGFKAGFSKADEVLATASRGIAEVITHHYTQNIDLRDAKTVLSNSGTAIMGSAKASGQNRAEEAISKALDSPLLNDNKITGAKNVLLLIVSGTDEITIDEIGEINDYIQAEAKTNVNIIMGIGEDESLGDAIAVTVVATGFHKDQQGEITYQAPRVIKHTLEGEQKVIHDFSEKDTFVSSKPVEESVSSEKIIHDLGAAEEEKINLVPTSEIIKNIDVVHEEISYEKIDDFVITSVVNEIEVVDHEVVVPETPEQITFEFDMPITSNKSEETPQTTIDINEIEVVDYEVVKPEVTPSEIYFDLGELAEEPELKKEEKVIVHEIKEEEVEQDMDIQMVVRAIPEKENVVAESVEDQSFKSETVSPLNLTISELGKRAEDRKKRMQQFNHKFNNRINSNNIDEIEKEPAYKRMGVELEQTKPSSESNQSKTQLSIDDNNELQFRSNNSFLHDNVD